MDIGSKTDPNFAGTADLEVKITPYALAIELGVGTHNLIAKSSDGCQDAIKVTVECKVLPPDCKSFIAAKSETLFTTCGTPSKLCIADLPFADIASYSILDNGNTFSGAITKCNDGTALTLTNGIHQLIFTNKAGCKDTMEARVACTTAKYVKETIYLNQKDTVCLDVAELLGSIAGIDNIWPGQSGAHAKFELIPGSRCITCLGVNAGGTDRAAYVITDDQGIRDTTFFEITVKAKDPKGPDAIEDAAKINQGDVMVLDVLANDKLGNLPLTEIRIVQQPKNAFVFVNNENKVVFTPNADFCDDNADESFTYKICTKEGCDEAPVLIKVLCSGIKVFTGFSPNGDGVNDTFVIEGAVDQSNNKLSIFNRYGNLVFFKEGYKNDWNGTWDGNNLPDGTYYYLYEDGKGETKAGYIQILR
jgi:gliding motility-associated-like protein